VLGERVKATPTISVLLIRLPMIGSSPHRKVITMITGMCGKSFQSRKAEVRVVLIAEITICAPITVSKLW